MRWLIALLLLLPSTAHATLVGCTSGTSATTQDVISISPTAGNALQFFSVGNRSSAAPPPFSVVDSSGGVFRQQSPLPNDLSGAYAIVMEGRGFETNIASGITSVTFNYQVPMSTYNIVCEYSGWDATEPNDYIDLAGTTGSGGNWSSATISPTASQAQDLVVFILDGGGSGSITCTSPFTSAGAIGNFAKVCYEHISSTSGTYTASGTSGASAPYVLAQSYSATTSTKFQVTNTSCAAATQYASYSSCGLHAAGGTAPYTFAIDSSGTYAGLPEGLALNSGTGAITASILGGQGLYVTGITVSDSAAHSTENLLSFELTGSTGWLSSIFPSNSIFYHRADAATTGLPVDTSAAAPIDSSYLAATISPGFATLALYNNLPGGTPAVEVAYNQALVGVTTTYPGGYQCYFGTTSNPSGCYYTMQTTAPIPLWAPVEGTLYLGPDSDRVVAVYQQAGGGNPPALFEMYQGVNLGTSWNDTSNAEWADTTTNNLTPQCTTGPPICGTASASGMSISPLVLTPEQVIGGGTPTSPSGTVGHPLIFTVSIPLSYYVWPATASAYQTPTDQCSIGGMGIARGHQLSQVTPPDSCTLGGFTYTDPYGELYRLKASYSNPGCAASSPQAAIVITALRNYGMYLEDGGSNGDIKGTPDTRWVASDMSCLNNITLNDFEPVNVSSLIVSNDSGQTPGSSTPSVSLSGAILSGGSIQ